MSAGRTFLLLSPLSPLLASLACATASQGVEPTEAPAGADASVPEAPSDSAGEGADSAASAGPVGIAECDFLLTRYRQCAQTVLGEGRDLTSVELLTEYFTQRGEQDREAARIECAHAVVTQRTEGPPACDWSGGPPMEALAARWTPPPADEASAPGIHVVETSAEGLDADVCGHLIGARRNELRTCLGPSYEGSFSISFDVDAQGNAGATQVRTADLPAPSVRCIEKGVNTWRFPKPAGDVATIESTLRVVSGD